MEIEYYTFYFHLIYKFIGFKILEKGFLKQMKTFLSIILGIIAAILVLIVKDYLEIRTEKLLIMKRDLTESYYQKDKLQELLKEFLQEKYTGKLTTDFDNYVVSLVLKNIAKLEVEKYQRYNDFLPTSKMKKYFQSRENRALKIRGKALAKNIFYIDIRHFQEKITYQKVSKLLFQNSNYSKLIIDLRNNSGGYVDELKKVAGLFLPKNKLICQFDYGNKEENFYSNNQEPLHYKKIVILVNSKTASVSELFVIALKEGLDNVTVVGNKTYGKQVSYGIRKFHDGSGMIFISAIMKGADGKLLNKDGITPDIVIGNTETFYQTITNDIKREEIRKSDAKLQLEKAVEYIK